jgi:hypothetical protein
MFFACWSVKGGSGTTVTAAMLAVSLARRRRQGALLVDLAGDLPAALGLATATGAGVAEWLRSEPVPADSLARLEVRVDDRLRLLPRGTPPWPDGVGGEVLAEALAADGRCVVVDCGTLPLEAPPSVPLTVVASATHSLLVLRPCYLALRRAQRALVRPSRLVIVREYGRVLDAMDVESVLGVPVLAEIALDPAVARSVDAGLLVTKVPERVQRVLRRAG